MSREAASSAIFAAKEYPAELKITETDVYSIQHVDETGMFWLPFSKFMHENVFVVLKNLIILGF